jgi:hypothetical protein
LKHQEAKFVFGDTTSHMTFKYDSDSQDLVLEKSAVTETQSFAPVSKGTGSATVIMRYIEHCKYYCDVSSDFLIAKSCLELKARPMTISAKALLPVLYALVWYMIFKRPLVASNPTDLVSLGQL